MVDDDAAVGGCFVGWDLRMLNERDGVGAFDAVANSLRKTA